jgi:hypothetical protein
MELHAAHGKYVLIPPSIHPSGTPYTWGGGPLPPDLPALPDLRDLWHPGGTHHTELLKQSAAKAHDGKDAETIYHELVAWREAHLSDPHAHPDKELRQLAESAVAKFQSERPPADSAVLFRDLVETWKVHAYLPNEWEYRVLALFSLQSRLAPRLPRVFYLFMAGTKGSGKTTILDHISEVCRALRFQNVSLPTLARAMGERPAPTVAIDEYDTTTGDRGTDEARNALVRQGYKANAAPFKRSEVSGGKVVPVEFPIYGPKALTFHRGVEDALQDRGFILPTEKGKDYAYVVRAISPKWADLIPRLDAWGEVARSNLDPARLLERVEALDFQSKVGRVLGTLGASRNAELVTVAVLVAEAAGVDLEVELRDALAAKEREATENEWVGVLADLLPPLAHSAPKLEEAPFYVVKQSVVKAELDKARKERRLPPCSATEFAGFRRDLGVRSEWVRIRGKVKYWHMPEAFVLDLESQGGLAGRDPEDLLGPGPTRSDRALANARREGSLAPDPPPNPYYFPPGGWGSRKPPTEEAKVEGVDGVTIRGGEVFYDPPQAPAPSKEAPEREVRSGGEESPARLGQTLADLSLADPAEPFIEEEAVGVEPDPSLVYPGGVLAKRWAEPPNNVLYRPPGPSIRVVHESPWEVVGRGAVVIYSDGAVVRRQSGEVLGRFRVAGEGRS